MALVAVLVTDLYLLYAKTCDATGRNGFTALDVLCLVVILANTIISYKLRHWRRYIYTDEQNREFLSSYRVTTDSKYLKYPYLRYIKTVVDHSAVVYAP